MRLMVLLLGRIVCWFPPQPFKPLQKTAMAVFWVTCGAVGLCGVGGAHALNALRSKTIMRIGPFNALE